MDAPTRKDGGDIQHGFNPALKTSDIHTFLKKTNMEKKITIQLKDGRWLVNNKKIEDCSGWEKDFMNRFFHEVKIENLI